MSTHYRPLIVGLVSPGLFWLATSVAHGQGSSSPQGRPSNLAPASSATFTVLLMSNGRVIRGEIADDAAGGVYRLKTPGGQVPYPKSSVKRAAQSIEEIYHYQVTALPPGDADERMKLVRWCLTEKLPEQAREQLDEVLKLCPEDKQARLMAANLDANSENRNRDVALRLTSGEIPPEDAPAALPPGIAKLVPKHFGNTLPEIFDLPPAMAVRRASEFAEYVQPVLQTNCTSCHGESYEGEFQLVSIRSIKDRRNPDIARANLDAVLRLVNPDDPTRSDILAAGLVPHGPKKGPIFRGANDRQYQILSAWVKSIRPKATPGGSKGSPFGGEGVSRAGYVPPEATDGFATDRAGRAGSAFATGVAADKAPTFTPPGTVRRVNEYNLSRDYSDGVAKDFPPASPIDAYQARPPAANAASARPSPKSATLPKLSGTSASSSQQLPEGPAGVEGPRVAPREAQQVAPGIYTVEADAHPNDLPGMNVPKYPTAADLKGATEPDEDRPTANPNMPASVKAALPKKKVKVDPALLEQMIKARNAKAP